MHKLTKPENKMQGRWSIIVLEFQVILPENLSEGGNQTDDALGSPTRKSDKKEPDPRESGRAGRARGAQFILLLADLKGSTSLRIRHRCGYRRFT